MIVWQACAKENSLLQSKMSEYVSENEASIARLEEADLSQDDSDNGFNLFFSVLVTEKDK